MNELISIGGKLMKVLLILTAKGKRVSILDLIDYIAIGT